MNKDIKNIAIAALDIGTSQIKLGVYCPFLSGRITIIGSIPNEIISGKTGEALSDYKYIREKSFQLFKKLGSFLKENNIKTLYLGICSHVSSLLEWNKKSGIPSEELFPIWLDSSCNESLKEFMDLMGNGKSKKIIGSFLPSGTNWLLTKLLSKNSLKINDEIIFLQVGDAIFFELSGTYYSHYSSQVSMVHQHKKDYSKELLTQLNLHESQFPSLGFKDFSILNKKTELFDFPDDSFVFPAMADFYASFYGLRLLDNEGFILANTSEVTGVFTNDKPELLENFVNLSFRKGYINYGSTNTGGNIINWFLTHILNKENTPGVLDELTRLAATIEPDNTPLFLPYLQGERAPFWNSKLTASFHGLHQGHSSVHLFRSILESIAFARRQCFEELKNNKLNLFKIAGGSSQNALWNLIRSSVINKPLLVSEEKELSITGVIDHITETISLEAPTFTFIPVEPDYELVNIYEKKYRDFLRIQKLCT
jgi:sugar (pentulose or hexulose) kinase